MPPPAVSSLARQTISCAFKELERTITPGDSRDFSSTTLQHVRLEVLKIEDELAARQALRNMRRLAPLFNGLEHYAKVMDVLCNGTPFLPWAWAPISLILRIASEHLEAFDQIIKGYSKIAECLSRFSKLSDTFKSNQDFQQTLAVFYADILEFHKHAYQFVRRSSWKLLFLTSWHRFQRRFDNIFESLQRHEALIDKEANAHNIAEAKLMRQEIRAWREESNEQLQRAEGEQSVKQYDSIVSWLRADDSDQLTISHALSAEAAKYPGTCDWVLRNKKMTSLLQRKPDVPLLWIQGAAGTGKSVLSSSIVTFMKSSDSLVLSHFCSHAYPSSTKYEKILRSLLLQLARQDGDLAAHVYENCVLGKKAPTIPVLEKLLQVLLSSICREPRQTSFVWIAIDGIDECDVGTQNNVFSLVSRVTSRASGYGGTICKALISCRFSDSASAKLRKKQSISLSDEKKHMSASIRRYASQRLESIYVKFQQLGLAENDVKEIEDAITNKSDGMFLYARLVLDYLSSNIFFGGQEIKQSVYELPKRLSEFYSKIMTQVLVRLDSRSVDRVKCALGWIAFSKRPLKKIEFLSAIAFSSGDINAKHVAPQYMLDICATLIEERPDSRLGFIHVSVKEFLQSSSSNLILVERECLVQHGIATITCLMAGMEAFSKSPPPESVLVGVLRGLHGFHIYSKEYWTDYLFSLATPHGELDTVLLFKMAHELAQNLSQLSDEPGHLPDDEENVPIGKKPVALADERILTLHDSLLRRFVNTCLTARSVDQLELSIQQAETRGSEESTPAVLPRPQDGVSVVLHRHQCIIRYLLDQADYPGISAAELESFKLYFRASAYTCRLSNCPRATEGFEREAQCHEHEMTHVRRLMCTFPACPYPPFVSSRALKSHMNKCHSPSQPRKSIRRAGEISSPALNQHDYESKKGSGVAVQDYQLQLALLEQQNIIRNDQREIERLVKQGSDPHQFTITAQEIENAKKHERFKDLSYGQIRSTLLRMKIHNAQEKEEQYYQQQHALGSQDPLLEHKGYHAAAEYDSRKRTFDDLNAFFGEARRRGEDPASYHEVDQRLLPRHGPLLLHQEMLKGLERQQDGYTVPTESTHTNNLYCCPLEACIRKGGTAAMLGNKFMAHLRSHGYVDPPDELLDAAIHRARIRLQVEDNSERQLSPTLETELTPVTGVLLDPSDVATASQPNQGSQRDESAAHLMQHQQPALGQQRQVPMDFSLTNGFQRHHVLNLRSIRYTPSNARPS